MATLHRIPYHFHAEGHALSGEFRHPSWIPIEAQAATSLPTIGGHGRAHVENFHLQDFVSFKRADTHVSGKRRRSDSGDTYVTSASTTIEDLDILGVVTASLIVCRLSSVHSPKSPEGRIIAEDSRFEGLRISGQDVKVTLRHNLLVDCETFEDLVTKGIANDVKSGRIAHASPRARLSSRHGPDGRRDPHQRISLPIVRSLLCFPLLAVMGCGRPASLPTAQLYESTRLKVKRGDLTAALMEVDKALRRFSTPDTEWHWRFTVLEGEILARQRLMKECLELLAPDLPGYLSQSDIAVWRKLTQGYANGFLGNLDESDKLFAEAEELAKEKHPELLGELALRKGTVAFFARGDPETAEHLFYTTLGIARQQQDPFLESSALGSLGLVATRQEHYDESIDWFGAALKLSRSVGAESSAVKTLGNLGWSYFEMGDYENARSLFQQAEQSFGHAGLIGDQLYSRINLAVSDYFLHEYASAEQESQRALDLARQRGEREGITQCLNNLSSIAMLRRDVDLAEKYNNEALQLSSGSAPGQGVCWRGSVGKGGERIRAVDRHDRNGLVFRERRRVPLDLPVQRNRILRRLH